MTRTSSPLPENYARRELELFHRVFAVGNEAGLYDALRFCQEGSVPVPPWALEASIIRQREYIFGEDKRHAKWLRQHKQDMIDMGRAEMVQELRGHGTKGMKVYEYAARFLAGTEYEGGLVQSIPNTSSGSTRSSPSQKQAVRADTGERRPPLNPLRFGVSFRPLLYPRNLRYIAGFTLLTESPLPILRVSCIAGIHEGGGWTKRTTP
jgi:hypothetical protein